MVIERKVSLGVTLLLACYMTLGKLPDLSKSFHIFIRVTIIIFTSYGYCKVLIYSECPVKILILIIVDIDYYFHLELTQKSRSYLGKLLTIWKYDLRDSIMTRISNADLINSAQN